MITLDTAGLLAALNADDPDHARAKEALARERGPLVIPVGILAELCYMIEAALGVQLLRDFVAELAAGFYELDCGEGDMQRIGELLTRYADLELGFADSCVIACAERRGSRVLTFDLRDFGPVAREGLISIVPGSE